MKTIFYEKDKIGVSSFVHVYVFEAGEIKI